MTELVECNTQLHNTLQGLWSDALTQHKLQQDLVAVEIIPHFQEPSFVILQHFFLASNDPIFSAHIPSSDSMDATYFIKPTDPHEIGFWNTPGTPPAPPNIPTLEEVQNNKNINV